MQLLYIYYLVKIIDLKIIIYIHILYMLFLDKK